MPRRCTATDLITLVIINKLHHEKYTSRNWHFVRSEVLIRVAASHGFVRDSSHKANKNFLAL
ncbi:hypothetical protein EJ04DRAFT_508474 [Polyplosphaeria fusca]|uniref:Uncharacterized protein n=1 Tax=Polyplosphaeria fusca TaxID=682080 RepID=A0A9P4R9D0_9PLEO|nr:hypothetical protein EJ04DRAFT_508474 [Polyplosphaeria fusca]